MEPKIWFGDSIVRLAEVRRLANSDDALKRDKFV